MEHSTSAETILIERFLHNYSPSIQLLYLANFFNYHLSYTYEGNLISPFQVAKQALPFKKTGTN